MSENLITFAEINKTVEANKSPSGSNKIGIEIKDEVIGEIDHSISVKELEEV
jgi:hypothetical protein